MGKLSAVIDSPGEERARTFVITLSSNKGGVGKTTVATNLPIFLRAIAEELPVLLVGLDDQQVVDRMFAIRERRPEDRNLKHAWAERSFSGVAQVGQYGIHFVPSPVETNLLRSRAEDPLTLRRILERTGWDGVVIIDTKSDLDGLTVNAICAADRVIVQDDVTLLEDQAVRDQVLVGLDLTVIRRASEAEVEADAAAHRSRGPSDSGTVALQQHQLVLLARTGSHRLAQQGAQQQLGVLEAIDQLGGNVAESGERRRRADAEQHPKTADEEDVRAEVRHGQGPS